MSGSSIGRGRSRVHGQDGCPRLLGQLLSLGSLFLAVACNERPWVCEGVDESRVAQLPERLSDTGLYVDIDAQAVATDVLPFRPQFQLWSDGAEKRRWLWLPEAARIDTEDMNAWSFPAGTKFWKEFTRDGVRVETRLLQKVGPSEDDWVGLAYVWKEDASDAVGAPYGVIDARGTPHNVPAANECMICHRGRSSRILGFSAVQLSYESSDGLDLETLVTGGLLTEPPASNFLVPGTQLERDALGYLNVNCGHCHNQERPVTKGARCFEPRNSLDVWLRVEDLTSPDATSTYRTAVRDDEFVVPGEPDQSDIIQEMKDRGFLGMPCVGSERVDEGGVALLSRWIEAL